MSRVALHVLGLLLLLVLPLTTISCERLVGIEDVVVVPRDASAPAPDGAAASRVKLTGVCMGPTAGTTFQPDGTSELVVLAQYEPAPTNREVLVLVNRTRPIVLALASYSATTWRVTLGPNARVDSVLLLQGSGGDASVLAGLTGVPQTSGTTNVSDPSMDSELTAIAAEASRRIPVPLAGYLGCYSGRSFEITDLD